VMEKYKLYWKPSCGIAMTQADYSSAQAMFGACANEFGTS
jgi:hypothetical protein